MLKKRSPPKVLYPVILVELILSDIYVEAVSELLVLHGICCHHSGVTASVSWGGGQLVVMVQKLLQGPSIFKCVSLRVNVINIKNENPNINVIAMSSAFADSVL